MNIVADTLDDLMRDVLGGLLKISDVVRPTKGANKEVIGALLRLRDPRARLSRTERKGTIFSCLGELCWYLAATNELAFMTYYLPEYKKFSDDGHTVHGAYGPRLFNMRGVNQLDNIAALLGKNPYSRRAVIQLFDAADLVCRYEDVPCTCSIQFFVRSGKLLAVTYMRSNDAYRGLPHDIFCFTMLQEMLARRLGLDLGEYTHCVGSLHLYDENVAEVEQYLNEGYQPTLAVSMPPMPLGDPRPAIADVLRGEHMIRTGGAIPPDDQKLDPYWADLLRLIKIFAYDKQGNATMVQETRSRLSFKLYDAYALRRQDRSEARGRIAPA